MGFLFVCFLNKLMYGYFIKYKLCLEGIFSPDILTGRVKNYQTVANFTSQILVIP